MTKREKSGSLGGKIFGAAFVLALLGVAAVVGFSMIARPFSTKVVDRSAPPVLNSLKDLSLYQAASAQMEVMVDLEKDVKYVPSALAGERTLFVGVGSVDAVIDFRDLTDKNITVSPDRKSATIVVPHAKLSPAIVDPSQSHVAARNRGLVNRLGDALSSHPTDDSMLYQAAQAKMADAASSTGVLSNAERNTTAMLEGLVKGLGFEKVVVVYQDGPIA